MGETKQRLSVVAIITKIVHDLGGQENPPQHDENLISYGIDSLDTVEVILQCEDAFGIEIPDSEIDGLVAGTVDQIAEIVTKLQSHVS